MRNNGLLSRVEWEKRYAIGDPSSNRCLSVTCNVNYSTLLNARFTILENLHQTARETLV